MKNLIAAIQFITAIPLGWHGKFEPSKMIPFFPVVGLLLGFLVAIFDHVALHLWPAPVVAVLDVIFLIILTGAFHLDGLGDTADGLYGQRTREQALAIMKDSRIGVMGLVAILCVLAVKWCGIAEMDSSRCLLILVIPAYSRSSMLFAFYFLPYGRPDGGTGRDFFTKPLNLRSFRMLLIPFCLSLLLGAKAILLNLSFIVIVALILAFYKRKLNAVTGDMLGAMTEIVEAELFLLLSI